jgi:hypothetical protein
VHSKLARCWGNIGWLSAVFSKPPPIFLAARPWLRFDWQMRALFSYTFSLALALTIAISNATENSSPPVDSGVSSFQPIAFLVGGTWHGQLPPRPNGQKVEIEMKADWTANHQGIRFDSTFVADGKRSPYVSGMYAWHPGKKQLVFLYSDAKGSLTNGAITIENDVLVHDFKVTEKDGKASKIQARITPQGPNAYLNEIFQGKDGGWEKVVVVRYERAG